MTTVNVYDYVFERDLPSDPIKFECSSPGDIYFRYCNTCGYDELKYQSCKICLYCSWKKRKDWLESALQRFDTVCYDVKQVVMWTFGSSIKYDPPYYTYHERKRDKRHKYNWIQRKIHDGLGVHRFKTMLKYYNSKQKDKKRWNSSFNWSPLLYSIEAGKNGRMHVHMLFEGYHPFDTMKLEWRKITGEDSNVNYSYKPEIEPKYAFKYASKYLYKEGGKKSWYWMGRMRNHPKSKTYIPFKYVSDYYSICNASDCDSGDISFSSVSHDQLINSL